jgi:hypothetical protein
MQAERAAHTPGPWVVSPFRAQVVCDKFGRDGDFLPVAQMLWPTTERTEAETYANGHLIAAAPELLEVAPDALDFLDQYAELIRSVPADDLERHPYLPAVEDTVDRLRAAIAKARGEA